MLDKPAEVPQDEETAMSTLEFTRRPLLPMDFLNDVVDADGAVRRLGAADLVSGAGGLSTAPNTAWPGSATPVSSSTRWPPSRGA